LMALPSLAARPHPLLVYSCLGRRTRMIHRTNCNTSPLLLRTPPCPP
jgi:hypothetical protein